MKKEDVLIVTVIMLFLQGFLFKNVFPALIAFSLVLYIAYLRFGFNPNLRFSREFRGRAVEGRHLSAVLDVENLDGKVYEVEVVEVLPRGFRYDPVRFRIEGRERRSVVYTVIPRRGVYDIGMPVLRVTDPSGLYFKDLRADGKVRLEVYPDVEEIVREAGDVRVNVSVKSTLGIKSDEVKSLRRYQTGDDLRFVDWKATARLMEIIVKEFVRETEGDVYIVLDAGREMRRGVREAKINYATTLAIQLAYAMRGRRVGFIVYDDYGVKSVLRASGSVEQIERFVRSLKFTPSYLEFISAKIPRLDLRFSEKSVRFVRKVRGRFASGILEVVSMLPSVALLIFIADITAHTGELVKVLTLLRERYRVYLITPNPILFYDRSKLTRDKIVWLYRRYLERERVLRRIARIVPTVDVGPSDLLELMRGVLG